jgi:hypothetical protein
MNPMPFELRDPMLCPYHAEGALEPAEIKARRAYRKRISKPSEGMLFGLHR